MKLKPIFKVKDNENGNPADFKVHYICRGYTVVYRTSYLFNGQDYTKTTSPTACLESFHILTHVGA
ncbi:hypothetical protein PAXRUDRAFT_68211, partial [Paxillus rubicundulus Ve08.2h10]